MSLRHPLASLLLVCLLAVCSSTAWAQASASFPAVIEELRHRLVEGVMAMAQRLQTLVQAERMRWQESIARVTPVWLVALLLFLVLPGAIYWLHRHLRRLVKSLLAAHAQRGVPPGVIEVMRDIDAEMRRDLAYGRDMLEPLEVMGLERFDDSAVVIRARLKTRPIQQWRIGREFNRRLKKTFDEHGIEIPFPHRTLYWGRPKNGPPPPLHIAMEERHLTHPGE